MNNIEKVREVMRDLNRLGDIGDTVTIGHEHLLALADNLRDAIPLAPRDARPGEFYRVKLKDDWRIEYVGTRPKDGVTVVQDGESITFQWRLLTELGNDTVADDDEIELITGRKLK